MCEICKFLKQTAAKLHVPVIVLSSLPRRTDGNFDHRPLLSDFPEVGYLENSIKKYFDIVIFLHRDEYYNPNSKTKNITEVIIAKHKNEIPRTVYLDWSPSSSQI